MVFVATLGSNHEHPHPVAFLMRGLDAANLNTVGTRMDVNTLTYILINLRTLHRIRQRPVPLAA